MNRTRSLLLNDGKLQIDKRLGWPDSAGSPLELPPEKSVLKLEPGDDVTRTESDFVPLSKAFFAGIEKNDS